MICSESQFVESLCDSLNQFFLALLCEFVNFLVDGLFVLCEEGADVLGVEEGGDGGLGVQQDEGDQDAEGHVGEVVEEQLETRRRYLNDREDYPVGQVADVVVLVRALEGQEGEVGRDQVADYAREQRVGLEDGAQHQQGREQAEQNHAGLDFVLLLDEMQRLHAVQSLKLQRLDPFGYLLHHWNLYQYQLCALAYSCQGNFLVVGCVCPLLPECLAQGWMLRFVLQIKVQPYIRIMYELLAKDGGFGERGGVW